MARMPRNGGQVSVPRTLFLNLAGRWFDDILAGTKTEEFRQHTASWEKRLVGKEYDQIVLMRGYPAGCGIEGKTRLTRRWRGIRLIPDFTHEHFGDQPVAVIAIDVSEPV